MVHLYEPHLHLNQSLCAVRGVANRTASGYDHMSEARHFEFVPLWGMKVTFSLPHAAGQLTKRCGSEGHFK